MIAGVDAIHKYFQAYGWSFDFDAQTATWKTGFRGETANFNVLLHMSDDWLYFAINPLVNAPRDSRCVHRLERHLLRVNHTVNLAKFSIDAEGDVVLTVELPTENLAYSHFVDALGALCHYADQHYLDLLNLAQDPEYRPQVSEELGVDDDKEGLDRGFN